MLPGRLRRAVPLSPLFKFALLRDAWRESSGGHRQKAVLRQYQLAKWQSTWTTSRRGPVKSLRGEIGSPEMLLETVINRCKDSAISDYSGKIRQMLKTTRN